MLLHTTKILKLQVTKVFFGFIGYFLFYYLCCPMKEVNLQNEGLLYIYIYFLLRPV